MSVWAQSGAVKDPDKWNVTLSPYLMLPWMDGQMALKGYGVDVNVPPSEIFSNLQFGVMTGFEARKSRWAIAFDADYMALGTTLNRDPILGERANADVDANQGAYTFMGLRELNQKVDFVFGARWNVLQGRIGLKGPQQRVFDQTQQWLDPIVGIKLRQPLWGKWHFQMEGDIGGFGAGSDFAWNLFPMLGVDVSKRTTLGIGYRVLGMNYKSGTSSDYFKYDVITQSFVLGAAFHF
ncbi:MAG: hypothetical protein HY821_20570 [Acidobacteria bacterium]|nr:hypothetical protein [Acidobacteriota bacterium]